MEFDDWLAALGAAGKGPFTLFASRGRVWSFALRLAGDWTGATLRGQVRSAPDAGGSAPATFTVSSVSVSGGYSSFILSLTATQTGALPAPAAGDGKVDLIYDLLLTPSGGDEELLFGGIFTVYGRATA